MILSIAMMFKYSFLNLEYFNLINKVVNKILNNGYRTKDIFMEKNNLISTQEMGNLVIEELENEKI